VRNQDLARDYIRRSEIRLKAVDVLFESGSWADVVRESQEIVELSLKALLRAAGIDPPRIHDVSEVLLSERSQLPAALRSELDMLGEASRQLRRDRELAFYGAEDLTPSDFYSRADAETARASARRTVALVKPHIPQGAHAPPRAPRKRRRT
jgi:HEPN domain-containing protein